MNKRIVGLIAFAMIIGLTGVASATTIFESDVPETAKTSGFSWEVSYNIVLPDGCFEGTITGSETGSFAEVIGDMELKIITKVTSTYPKYAGEFSNPYWP